MPQTLIMQSQLKPPSELVRLTNADLIHEHELVLMAIKRLLDYQEHLDKALQLKLPKA